MKITRKEPTIIGDYDDPDPLRLCPHCLEHGFMGVLGPRILLPNEVKQSDFDQWLTCNSCYATVPIYEAKTESQIEDFSELTENPFHEGSNITGLENKRSRKTDIQKRNERMLAEADKIPDSEISEMARSGIKVEYEDTNPEFGKEVDSNKSRLRKELFDVVNDAFSDY